ncbi:hypothetical protein A5708_19485 [Mycobacterium colombiense]|uniref:Uncharacterized protein n=1 Tax=Mycobacterium colombiense TaxID=339268 RepID=A0A1A2Z0I6_9MYCO|nr:hypothetical protein A5708_19485 [Mycobacterium colombiense]
MRHLVAGGADITSTVVPSAERPASVAATSCDQGCAVGEQLTPKEFEVLRVLPTRRAAVSRARELGLL